MLASKTLPAAVGAGPGKAMPNAVGLRARKAMSDSANMISDWLRSDLIQIDLAPP